MTRPIHRKSNSPINTEKLTFFSKDAKIILRLLEQTAQKLGINVRYETIFPNGEPWDCDGGYCRLQKEHLLIVDTRAPAKQKCHIILEALSTQKLDNIFVPPIVRQMLDTQEQFKR